MIAARPQAARTCTFRTQQRGDIWQVTRDKVFYGDYNSQAQAVAAACYGARAAEAQGACASVRDGPTGRLVPHQLEQAPS